MIIVFEGPDKSGKTTLINEINKRNNYVNWILDRSFISSIVYAQLFNRDNVEIWIERAKNLLKQNKFIFILCECDENIIIQRLKEAHEILPKELVNIEFVRNMFEYTLKLLNCEYIKINTSLNMNDNIIKILKYINSKEDYQ